MRRLLPTVGVLLSIIVLAAASAAGQSNSAPGQLVLINTSPPTITGVAAEGNMLTGNTGGWSSGPSATYDYQWNRCNSSGALCAPIATAKTATYAVLHAPCRGDRDE